MGFWRSIELDRSDYMAEQLKLLLQKQNIDYDEIVDRVRSEEQI